MRFLNRFKLFLGIIIPIFGFFLMSHNTYAADNYTYTQANVDFYAGQQVQATVNLPWTVNPGTHRFFLNNLYLNYTGYSGQSKAYVAGRVAVDFNPKRTQNVFICGLDLTFNLGIGTSSHCLGDVYVVYSDNTSTIYNNIPVYINQTNNPFTVTLYFDFAMELVQSKNISFIQFRYEAETGYDVYSLNVNNNDTAVTVLVTGRSSINNYASLDQLNQALLQQQINQNNTIIEQNNNYYNHEYEAENNISSQTTSDIPNSSDQQTTNLIGLLSSFLSQLQAFSATNCNLALPFPEFIGGTQTVNICQGKDVLGNFITIIGTLTMVVFYIPLAVVLLRMIYNEIRSFTNG